MKDDKVYLQNILEGILKLRFILIWKRRVYEVKSYSRCIIRNLEIIGEATKKISQELKNNTKRFPGDKWPVSEMC